MTAAARAASERLRQGLPAVAAPCGHPTYDTAVSSAYRRTGLLLASAPSASHAAPVLLESGVDARGADSGDAGTLSSRGSDRHPASPVSENSNARTSPHKSGPSVARRQGA